jgi:hypothetical protein
MGNRAHPHPPPRRNQVRPNQHTAQWRPKAVRTSVMSGEQCPVGDVRSPQLLVRGSVARSAGSGRRRRIADGLLPAIASSLASLHVSPSISLRREPANFRPARRTALPRFDLPDRAGTQVDVPARHRAERAVPPAPTSLHGNRQYRTRVRSTRRPCRSTRRSRQKCGSPKLNPRAVEQHTREPWRRGRTSGRDRDAAREAARRSRVDMRNWLGSGPTLRGRTQSALPQRSGACFSVAGQFTWKWLAAIAGRTRHGRR